MKNRRLGLIALLALALVWLVAPQGVPLYDGIGEPEQAYRYASPPPGAEEAPAPDRMVKTVDSGGLNNTLDTGGNTADLQLQMSFPAANFTTTGATTFVMTGTALAPDSPPAGLSFSGNMYRLAAELPAGVSVKWTPLKDRAGLVLIRATVTDKATMCWRPSASAAWKPLESEKFSQHSTAGTMMGLGDYAVAVAGERRFESVAASGGDAAKSSSSLKLPQIIGGLVLLMALVLLVVRLARRRRTRTS